MIMRRTGGVYVCDGWFVGEVGRFAMFIYNNSWLFFCYGGGGWQKEPQIQIDNKKTLVLRMQIAAGHLILGVLNNGNGFLSCMQI